MAIHKWSDLQANHAAARAAYEKKWFKWARWWHYVTEFWWLIRGYLWDRYNVVKVRTLAPTYVDRDTVMLHAIFQIVCDFCEKELKRRPTLEAIATEKQLDLNRGDPWAAEVGESQGLRELELWWMYDWWKNEYPQHPKGWNRLSYTQEEELSQEVERRLKRIIELRPTMWT